MKAELTTFTEKDRQVLGDIVPLAGPITVFIEASSACDLRCGFCTFSSPQTLDKRKHINKNMSQQTFDLILQQLKGFNRVFARINFSGLGEVLLNPRLPEMVKAVKQSGMAEKVEIVTNAMQLTEQTSLSLMEAGLDAIVISVNGLDANDYRRFCAVEMDYQRYLEQTRFLFAHKGQMRISLKTTDAVIAGDPQRQQRFFDLYGDYCDRINIETIAPFHAGAALTGESGALNRHGSAYDPSSKKVCAWCFYKLCIFSDGRVNFCDQIMGPVDELNIHLT